MAVVGYLERSYLAPQLVDKAGDGEEAVPRVFGECAPVSLSLVASGRTDSSNGCVERNQGRSLGAIRVIVAGVPFPDGMVTEPSGSGARLLWYRSYCWLRKRCRWRKIMPKAELLQHAEDLSRWLHARLDGRAMPAPSDQDRVGVALLQHAQDISDAIWVLVDRNLPGPALALARPLVEAYARAIWALRCAKAEDIDSFLETGRLRPWRFQDLVAVLKKGSATAEAEWLEQMEKQLSAFHDLTHGGRLHVLGRVDGDTIEPNYAEQDVESLLGISIEVELRSGLALFELMGDATAMEGLAVFSERLDRRPLRHTSA